MEVVSMEASTFKVMMAGVESFARRVETLYKQHGEKCLQEWLDNQDVCEILGISKRILQTYRDNETLAFSQIGHKMYYRREDVKKLMDDNLKRCRTVFIAWAIFMARLRV